VLAYTCSNDISARTQQFKNSQWSFSKGMYNFSHYRKIGRIETCDSSKTS